MVVGKPPALTATQAHFCAVMRENQRAGLPTMRAMELAMKFNCSYSTIRNAVLRKYVKHHVFAARA